MSKRFCGNFYSLDYPGIIYLCCKITEYAPYRADKGTKKAAG